VPEASQLQGTLPCENDQAKPDRFSRLARSTNLSKILNGGSPERGRGSRFPDLHPDVLELVLRRVPEASLPAPAFLREPFKHIELRFMGQAVFMFLMLIPTAFSMDAAAYYRWPSQDRVAQKYQRSTANSAFSERAKC